VEDEALPSGHNPETGCWVFGRDHAPLRREWDSH
jgi:hypothetical protein